MEISKQDIYKRTKKVPGCRKKLSAHQMVLIADVDLPEGDLRPELGVDVADVVGDDDDDGQQRRDEDSTLDRTHLCAGGGFFPGLSKFRPLSFTWLSPSELKYEHLWNNKLR